jgi:hypothetical protein
MTCENSPSLSRVPQSFLHAGKHVTKLVMKEHTRTVLLKLLLTVLIEQCTTVCTVDCV